MERCLIIVCDYLLVCDVFYWQDAAANEGAEDAEGDKPADRSKGKGVKQAPGDTAASGIDTDTRLWVDKYSPKTFTHLLSDEAINREVRGRA